jgi:hypothetical protein
MIVTEQRMIDLLRSHTLLYLISLVDVRCSFRHQNTLPRFIGDKADENK